MNDGDLTMECGLRIQRVLFVLYLIHGKSIFQMYALIYVKVMAFIIHDMLRIQIKYKFEIQKRIYGKLFLYSDNLICVSQIGYVL